MDKLRDAVDMIIDLQQRTAPIKLTIGWVTPGNVVRHNAIVVHEAPPAATKALASAFSPTLIEDGLLIEGTWN